MAAFRYIEPDCCFFFDKIYHVFLICVERKEVSINIYLSSWTANYC